MKPLIGITPSPDTTTMGHGMFYRYTLSRTYVDAVRSAGGIPVILPTDSLAMEEVVSRLDGLILSGGGDIEPQRYGDGVRHETTDRVDDERDAFELEAFQYAATNDVPTLCICRGIQVMAVAVGGKLDQDIASTNPDALEHRQQKLGRMRDATGHSVTLTSGNPLYAAIGSGSLEVNSFHHQAVSDPGSDLAVIATSSDGVIEGLWHPDMRFGIGVQWHPEMLADRHPLHASIFQALVSASAGS